MEYLIKPFSSQEAELNASLLERNVILERFLRGLCGILVTDVGVQRGNEHERIVKIVVHLLTVCLDSNSAVLIEGIILKRIRGLWRL